VAGGCGVGVLVGGCVAQAAAILAMSRAKSFVAIAVTQAVIEGVSSAVWTSMDSATQRLLLVTKGSTNEYGNTRAFGAVGWGALALVFGAIFDAYGLRAGFALRFVFYSCIGEAPLESPWWTMPAELLHGFTFALGWAASTQYLANLLPAELSSSAQGLLAVTLFGPAVLGEEYQHQGGAVAEEQQVSSSEEHAQVRAPAVHVCEHRAQAGGKAYPAAPAEHPGVGAQGVSKES
jgi:hypothetical protein